MKKKAESGKQSFFTKLCLASEKTARVSLVLAGAIVLGIIGTVSAVAIRNNSNVELPSENVELNAAQEYLDKVAFADGESDATSESEETQIQVNAVESSEETKETKRGGLTGENIVDVKDLKSLSDEDLLKAVKQGKVKVIAKKDIKQDQSQNVNVTHKGSIAEAPKATNTPTPKPTTPPAVAITVTPKPTPTMAPIKVVNYQLGIDISEFQGTIDWKKVKADGIEFAFIRCGGRGYSKGGLYEDKKFAQNVKNAKAAGVKVGAYFFSQAITVEEAIEEASLTLAMVNGYGMDLPVVMDWETGSGYRTQVLKGQDFANVLDAYCTMIAQNGYTPCVYLCSDDINNRLGKYSGQILGKYKLWYAYPYSCYWKSSSSYKSNYYQTGDTIPPRSYAYEYWQYSWHGKVSGISTEVDLNIRILGNTTLKAPEINITNKAPVTSVGRDFNPMDGVTGKTSQGVSTTKDLTYALTNASGQAVSLDQAKQTIGKYLITYTFKDPFRGTITDTAVWEVTAATATDTPTPVPESSETSDPSSGATDTPTPVPESGATDTPTPTPEGSVDTPTPTPTSTPTPTPVPQPSETNGGGNSGSDSNGGGDNTDSGNT